MKGEVIKKKESEAAKGSNEFGEWYWLTDWRYRSKIEKDENGGQKSIGDLKPPELEIIIRSIIREQADSGSSPLRLSRGQKKTLKRWIWAIAIAFILGLVWYRLYEYDSEYSVRIEQNRLFVYKTIDGTDRKYEMIEENGQWKICPVDGSSCGRVQTSLEAKWFSDNKFVFLTDGTVYWIEKDPSQNKRVRLIRGELAFEDDASDEGWTTFEALKERSVPDE